MMNVSVCVGRRGGSKILLPMGNIGLFGGGFLKQQVEGLCGWVVFLKTQTYGICWVAGGTVSKTMMKWQICGWVWVVWTFF